MSPGPTRRRARIIGLLALFAPAFAPAPALAQQTGGALDRFDPAPAGDTFFSLPSADVAGRLRFIGSAEISYAHDPLVLRTIPSGAVLDWVSDQAVLHVQLGVEVWKRLKLDLDVPALLADGGTSGEIDGQQATAPSGAHIGDVRVAARGALLHQQGFVPAVGLSLSVWAPSGSPASFAGAGVARFQPGVTLGAEHRHLVWSASLGARFQPHTTDGVVGSQIVGGVGVAARFLGVTLGPELFYGASAGDARAAVFSGSSGGNAELLVGARYRLGPLGFGLAAGPGLGRGPGTPAYRLLAGITGTLDALSPDAEGEGDASPRPVPPAPPGPPPPLDTDGDGVPDAEDACPTIVGDATPGAYRRGCPADRDRDGIPDAEDACPDVPGVPSNDPARNGCPLDTDGDGIPDDKDACPTEKGPTNEDPRLNGCPAGSAVRIEGSQIIILQQVNFDTGKATITKDSFNILSQVAALLESHPGIARVTVDGHTDNRGGDAPNKALSEKRALAVVLWLTEHGVDARRLEARGFGMRRPIAANITTMGRAKNRRVEFLIRRFTNLGKAGWIDGPIVDVEGKPPPSEGRAAAVKLSIRAKTVLLLAGVALIPMAGAVGLLIDANETPVRITEQHLQSAVVNEIVQGAMRPLEQVQDDAQAVAAVLSRAAEGAIPDDAAVEAARALVGGRASIDAVRFEVPAAKLSTVIRWRDTAEVVPESTPELRARADADGVAISVAGTTRGIVVARVKPPPGKPASGYVTVRADLDAVARTLQDTAAQRFHGGVSLVLATEDRRVVAAAGVPSASPGESVASLPVWQMLPTRPPEKGFSVTSAFTDGTTPMVGTLQNVPRNGWVVALWRPESVAYQTLAEMRLRGLAVAAVAAVLAALIGLLVARGLTAPILAIVGQARLIARRKWREVSLSSTRSDEIGELTRGLGEMARDLEHGEIEAKLRGDLSRFMSKQLVDAIVKGEHPLSLGGKRAAVSVVFADVVGFTPLAESRDAEQIVGLLNELFSVLTEIVFRHGGTVDKFIGDAIMAVWGAPVPQEDHAARALGAAEDMMRFLETANEGWRDKYDVEIRLGIGVNSGEALVGNIGSDKRMEYTVIGDVVNVAARLEAIAQPNQVLVAEATRDLVGDAFALRKLGSRKLTGRKTETGVFELEVE